MNPAAGKLSSQLAAKNSSGKGPEPKQPDRLVVSTRLSVRCRFWFRLADRLETSGTEHDGARCDRDSMDWQRRVRMCPAASREACRLISRAQIRFDLDSLLDGIHFPIKPPTLVSSSGWAQLQLSVFSTFSHFEGLDFATLSFPIPSLSRGGASSFHSYLYIPILTIVHSPLYPFGSPILFRPGLCSRALAPPAHLPIRT